MLTPMSITSLDQGKDLARWQVRRLYAEAEQQSQEEAPHVEVRSVPSRWQRVLNALFGTALVSQATGPVDACRPREVLNKYLPAE